MNRPVPAIIGYAVLGGAAAFAVGYFLSAGVVALGSSALAGIPGGQEALAAIRRDFFSVAGLSYLAFHTIAITGFGGGERVTIDPPLTLFTVLPIAALLLGGYMVGRAAKQSNVWNSALAGALIAPCYVIIALLFRPLFAVDTTPYQGLQFGDYQNPLPDMIMGGTFLGTLVLTGAFAVVFGGLGGMRAALPKGWLRGLIIQPGVFPAWLNGALAAFLIAQVFLSLVILVLGVETLITRRMELERHGIRRPTAIAIVTLAPTAAGIGYYFFQGARIHAGADTRVGDAGMSNRISAGLFFGAREVTVSRFNGEMVDSRLLPLPALAYAGMLFIGLVFLAAGHLAARTAAGPRNRWSMSLWLAIAHTAILLALVSLYGASITREWQIEDGTGRSVVSFGFVPWTVIIFPLAIALIFSLVGTATVRRRRELE